MIVLVLILETVRLLRALICCKEKVLGSQIRILAKYPTAISIHAPGSVSRETALLSKFLIFKLGVTINDVSLSLSGLMSCVVVVNSFGEFFMRSFM
jgi:hypothetical protein